MDKKEVSVIICTYDRPPLLKGAIESVIAQRFDRCMYEIIVIDNGKNPITQEVVEEIRKISPINIVYEKEETQGLSFARNRGLKIAQGRIVIYLDDDEVAQDGWLREIYDTYQINSLIGCVGGKIIPVFMNNPTPSWYSKELQGFFGGVDNGDVVHEININNEYLGGGNISFKRQIVFDLGMFNTNLGIRGNTFYSGEETELYVKIMQMGYKVIYNPNAITYHLIEKERISKKHLYRRAFQNGISDAFSDYKSYKNIHGKSREPIFHIMTKYTLILLKCFGSLVKGTFESEQKKMKASLSLCRSFGKIYGLIKMSIHSLSFS